MRYLIGTCLLVLVAFLVTGSLSSLGERQYVFLTERVLGGSLDFGEMGKTFSDTTTFKYKLYWPLGIGPVFALAPVVAVFGTEASIGITQGVMGAMIGVLIWIWMRKWGYSRLDTVVWELAFFGGSAMLGVQVWPWSWQFAQVVGVFGMVLALVMYFVGRSWWMVGLGLAISFLSRTTTILSGWYFSAQIFSGKKAYRKVLGLVVPVVVGAAIWGGYNYVRFGNMFESGYSLQRLPDFLDMARGYGLFGMRHLPGNLYYFLIAGPVGVFEDSVSHVLKFPYITADHWGMGLFWTSPYLIYLFKRKWKMEYLLLMVAAAGVMMPILLYYGIGWRQFGYRYFLDAWPLVFGALAGVMRGKRLPKAFVLMVVSSVFLNIYLFLGAWSGGYGDI